MKKVIKLKFSIKPKEKTSRKNAKKSGKPKARNTETNKFYITTAIPYVNAKPHIGHALEFIQTDCIKRYHSLKGINTFLTTGADENSLKNVQAAESERISAQQLCDRNAAIFRKLADTLLSYDSFLRSSSHKDHWPGVHKLWKLCNKDIYKKKYRGLYCVGCETFYTESDLKDGKCPEHLTKPELIEEENYFFRLSKYQEKLTKLIETDKIRIVPETRKHEVLSFIKSGLEDFSVSRSITRAKGWGVPVHGDKEQIIYVWVDALNVYQTGVGFGTDEKLYKKWWPCSCHVIGKGIIRFHAVYWPAILLSAGLKLPKSIFVHGYITVDGQKMSKSLGNIVDPFTLIGKYGTDRLRYYILQLPAFDDGDFSEKHLVETTNNELVSNYSNLFYRVTYFIGKNYNGIVPKSHGNKDVDEMEELLAKTVDAVEKHMEEYRLNEALKDILHLVGEANKYFQSKKPWETLGTKDCGTTLYVSVNALRTISTLLYPFIPESSERALNALDIKEKKWSQLKRFAIKHGHKIKSEMLFKKIDEKEAEMPKTVRSNKEPRFFIEKEVADLGIKAKAALITGVKIKKEDPRLEEKKEDLLNKIIIDENIIKGYRELYNKLGIKNNKTAVESLLENIKKNNKIPAINTAVDSYNIVSVSKSLAAGLHDVDKIEGDVRLRITDGSEFFVPLGQKEREKINAGEYACVDDNHVLCRLEVKQGEHTKIDKNSRNLLLYVQGNRNTSDEYLNNALLAACNNITKFCGGSYRILRVEAAEKYTKSSKEDIKIGKKIEEKEVIQVINGMIPFNEFKKLDLRIGTITDVQDHPNADKLYILQVDMDSEKRQLVAGLKGIYSKDELKGKQITVICNLEPKEMRGIKSEGMLLAADDGTLLITEKKVKNGVKVR